MSRRSMWILAGIVLIAVGGVLSILPLSGMLNELIGGVIVKH